MVLFLFVPYYGESVPHSEPELSDSASAVPWKNESHVLWLAPRVTCCVQFVFVEDLVPAHLPDSRIPLTDSPLNFCGCTVDCSSVGKRGSSLDDILLHLPHPPQVAVVLVKVLVCVCNLWPCQDASGSEPL